MYQNRLERHINTQNGNGQRPEFIRVSGKNSEKDAIFSFSYKKDAISQQKDATFWVVKRIYLLIFMSVPISNL